MTNYYEVLGVPENATYAEIRQAYRNFLKNNRHDKLVDEAYLILSNPKKRSEYRLSLDEAAAIEREEMYKQRRIKLRELSDAKRAAYKPNFVQVSEKNSITPKNDSTWKIVGIVAVILFIVYLSDSDTPSNSSPYSTISPTSSPTPTIAVKVSPTKIATPKPTAQATLTPTAKVTPTGQNNDCIGPDGIHFSATQKECDDFNNAWKPKPTPTSQTSSCGNNAYSSYGYCYCNDGYTKNYSSGQCEACPANSYGSYGSCYCNNGYTKNYSTNQCEKLICPSNSHESGNSCLCNDNYVKNYSNGQCEACPANSTYSYGYCSCNVGYTKNYSSGQCDKI